MATREVKLYGGAIICELPLGFDDLSEFLPVSDNQEVFVYHYNTNSDPNSDQYTQDFVLSFEILQYLSGANDMEAGRKLFDDLSFSNDSRNSNLETLKLVQGVNLGLPEPCDSVFVSGTMEVCRSKFYRGEFRTINVLLYDVRLPEFKCEFLVSYSYPLDSKTSNSYQQLLFEGVVRTLRIVDTNLFSV